MEDIAHSAPSVSRTFQNQLVHEEIYEFHQSHYAGTQQQAHETTSLSWKRVLTYVSILLQNW